MTLIRPFPRLARKLDRLNLRDPIHIAWQLSIPIEILTRTAEDLSQYYNSFSKPIGSKVRQLYKTEEPLTGILVRLNRTLQRLKLPRVMHGSIPGRSCLTNARPHFNARAWLKLDIKDFFPSVTSGRIYKMFTNDLSCAPDVARLLTQLTTVDGRLPQGFPTSPVIANLIARPLSRRLAKLASQHGARFTQYLDDITISGSERVCRLRGTAIKIVHQEKFLISPEKIKLVRRGEECIVTGVRVDRGLDAPTEMKESLEHHILLFKKTGYEIKGRDLASLQGRVAHVGRLNPQFGKRMTKRIEQLNRNTPPFASTRIVAPVSHHTALAQQDDQ